MKNLTLFLCAILYQVSLLNSQNLHDAVWMIGYPQSDTIKYGGTKVDFSQGDVKLSTFQPMRYLIYNNCISDENGLLQYYTNGCLLFNRNHQIMDGGDSLNYGGDLYEELCVGDEEYYTTSNAMISLPWPKHPGFYKFFTIHANSYFSIPISMELYEATIDMHLNGGLGAVVEKNVAVIDSQKFDFFIEAVRHGNGTDWWLVVTGFKNKNYSIFLFDSSGVHPPRVDTIGILENALGSGQATFSPDGKYYAEASPNRVQVMQFDRCTGDLFNPVMWNPFDTSEKPVGYCGVAFSPSSRFLYISRFDTVFQFDMHAPDFRQTQTPVGIFDTSLIDPLVGWPVHYRSMQLAPNGKIYNSMWSSNSVFHIIHQPDQPGAACEFQNFGMFIPRIWAGLLPNFPNYRLGIQDPPCTSGGLGRPAQIRESAAFNLYPNPFNALLTLGSASGEVNNTTLAFQLFDVLGRLVFEKSVAGLPQTFELGFLKTGEYYYQILNPTGRVLGSGSVVKGE